MEVKKGESEIRKCCVCGNEFEATYNGKRKYCSPECRDAGIDLNSQAGIWLVYNRDEFSCIYCGRSSIEKKTILVGDHIISVARGGLDTAANIVTSCIACNLSKSAKKLPPKTEARILKEVARRNEAFNIHPLKEIKAKSHRRERLVQR